MVLACWDAPRHESVMRKLGRVVPGFLKRYLRPLYRLGVEVSKRLGYRRLSRTDVHDYWRTPPVRARRTQVRALQPKPWPVNRGAALAKLESLK